VAVTEALSASNAVSLLNSYDVIMDCTDNSPTRYLLSDTAVYLGKPLVSGVCFVSSPGPHPSFGTKEGDASLLLFSALGNPPFRTVKLRSRKPTCPACGKESQKMGEIRDIDYVAFCGGPKPDWEARGLVDADDAARIQAKDLKAVLDSKDAAQIIDVRPKTEFGICQIPGSINVPLNDLVADPASHFPLDNEAKSIYVVCRLGNDSQIAADALRGQSGATVVMDLIGGLKAWTKYVDPSFPVY